MGGIFTSEAVAEAAATAEKRDYYANLTDQEREEEGLPPLEAPKPAPAPDPEPEPEPETEAEPDGGGDSAVDELLDEIQGLRREFHEAIDEPETAKTETREGQLLASGLESDDPSVRAIAEMLQEAHKRLEAVETDARNERVERQLAKDASDFDAVKANYAIGGKPLTEEHIEKVEDYILSHKEVGSRLSIEEVTRVVLPDAVRVGSRPTAAKGPGAPTGVKGQPVATIVDEGASGGAPAAPWAPAPNETIESAVKAAGKRLGWTR
jgi:two-component system chemotaxis sensor kinase CheA